MSRLGFIRRLRRDRRGVSIVEFGLMIIPFTLVMVGLVDISYQMYVHSVFQGAANDAARIIGVESPNLGTSGSLQDRVKQLIQARMQNIDMSGAVYTVQADTYYRYSDHGKSEKLTYDKDKDGQYDAADDCWQDTNPNGIYDSSVSYRSGVGGADDVIQFTVNLKMPRLVPIGALWGDTNQLDMNVTTAVKRQPYQNQQQPAQICPA
jgi:Flp pilus assembly protein TadG